MSADRDALEYLRAHHAGVLVADETAFPLRFVMDRGRVVFPDPAAVAGAENLTLFVPREDPSDEPELQLMLEAAALDPDSDGAADRWRVYHGDPRVSRWAACRIGGAKFQGAVVDHEPMGEPNPLAAAEPRLLRELNADRSRLAGICRPRGVEPRDPVAVGLDPGGVDVRARFGILRVPFAAAAGTEDEARAAVRALAGGAA